jgi:hypothetical protein
MDWTTLAVSIVSGILGIGAVATFMAKYMPAVSKWVTIAKDAVETLSDVSASLAKGPLTSAEITQLQADVTQFRADLATALGK